jgi:uncharacterized membrane protein YfcA
MIMSSTNKCVSSAIHNLVIRQPHSIFVYPRHNTQHTSTIRHFLKIRQRDFSGGTPTPGRTNTGQQNRYKSGPEGVTNTTKEATATATKSAEVTSVSKDATQTGKNTLSDTAMLARTAVVGSLAGAMGAMTGMGGGFVMVPMIASRVVVGLSQHQAHGTSSFAVAATGLAGAIGYGIKDTVNMEYAIAIAATGMLGARAGATVTSRLSGATLKKMLGVFMLSVAPIVPAKSYFAEKYGQPVEVEKVSETKDGDQETTETHMHIIDNPKSQFERLFPPAAIGCASGFLMGIFGVGGGAVVVPALTIFTDLNHYEALATSLCSMVLPSVVGTITHYQKGNVAMRVAMPLSIGAFTGAYIGAQFAHHISEEKLRYGFAGIMLTLGTKTLLRL